SMFDVGRSFVISYFNIVSTFDFRPALWPAGGYPEVLQGQDKRLTPKLLEGDYPSGFYPQHIEKVLQKL
ncbi:MAG: hypothetical protein J7M30_09235, partial [Deltaproteobacteria bacterium]|nr:hypothetical protein [Deltaproteobacteria bacterium]